MPQRQSVRGKRRKRRTPPRNRSVYVVELDRAASPDKDSTLPPVYVGMTSLAPEERLANHKRGHKASRVVRRHGLRLLPSLYVHLDPMTYSEALRADAELAVRLRERGYVVFGGH